MQRKAFFEPVEERSQSKKWQLCTERFYEKKAYVHSVSVTNKTNSTTRMTIGFGPQIAHAKITPTKSWNDTPAGFTQSVDLNMVIEMGSAIYVDFEGIMPNDELILFIQGHYIK